MGTQSEHNQSFLMNGQLGFHAKTLAEWPSVSDIWFHSGTDLLFDSFGVTNGSEVGHFSPHGNSP